MVASIGIPELAAARDRGDVVVDVRERFEYVSGHVPGAVHMPMHTVPLRVAELPQDRPLYLVCETGNRSWQVAAFLARQGLQAVNVDGGTSAWRAAGQPITTGASA